MNWLKALVLIGSCCYINGYPTGAPVQVCNTMVPGHGAQQDGESPISLQFDNVTGIMGPIGEYRAIVHIFPLRSYKGFLLKAHQVRRSSHLGTFQLLSAGDPFYSSKNADNAKLMPCGGSGRPDDPLNMVTHTNNNDKTTMLSFLWIPPSNFRGNVQFQATVVEEKSKYWRGVESEELSIDTRTFTTPTTPTPVPRFTTPTPVPRFTTPTPVPKFTTPTPTVRTTTGVMCLQCEDFACYPSGKCSINCTEGFYSPGNDGYCYKCAAGCGGEMCHPVTGVCDDCYSDGFGLYCDEMCYKPDMNCCKGKRCTSDHPHVSEASSVTATIISIVGVMSSVKLFLTC